MRASSVGAARPPDRCGPFSVGADSKSPLAWCVVRPAVSAGRIALVPAPMRLWVPTHLECQLGTCVAVHSEVCEEVDLLAVAVRSERKGHPCFAQGSAYAGARCGARLPRALRWAVGSGSDDWRCRRPHFACRSASSPGEAQVGHAQVHARLGVCGGQGAGMVGHRGSARGRSRLAARALGPRRRRTPERVLRGTVPSGVRRFEPAHRTVR